MSNLIIFDLDGTLYRTESSYYPAVAAFMKHYDRSVPDEAFLNSLIGEPQGVFDAWIGSLNIPVELPILMQDFVRFEIEAVVRNGQLYEGVKETLEALYEEDHIMGICSNGPLPYVNAVTSKFGLTDMLCFTRVPGNEAKSKTIMISEIMTDFPRDNNFMVGDRYHDMTGALENGIKFIAARYGFGGKELDEAEFKIEEPAQLLEIVM